jgi:flagellar biosynthetic protein FlhB
MAEREQEQNRTEQATSFKLKEARDRGLVVKSVELNSALVTLAFVALLYVVGRSLLERQLRLDASLLSQAHRLGFSESAATSWLTAALADTLGLLAPVFGVLIAAGVLAGLVQTGPVFSFEPLKPEMDRINPVSGLKRLFSIRMVFEAVKGLIKLALVGYALFSILEGLVPLALALSQTAPAAYARIGIETVGALIFKLSLVMLAIALIDAAYVRWEYRRRMMMSRRELREELKHREGDPKIRARIRELQREMRKRGRALKRVPEADVLITNPQHLAVALLYRREKMSAPQMIAKGAGEMAQRMTKLARRHGVTVVENRRLARALFLRAKLDEPIPPATYPEAARVLAWVYSLRDLKKQSSEGFAAQPQGSAR